MTRTYTLTGPADAARFHLLYQGFLLGGNLQQSKGIEILRREIQILDLFDGISTAGTEESRTLQTGTQTFAVDVPQYDLVSRYLTAVNWRTALAREAVALIDWWTSQPPDGPA